MYEGAIQDLSRLIKLDPEDHEAYSFRGEIFEELKKFDEALSDFKKAGELGDGWSEVKYELLKEEVQSEC